METSEEMSVSRKRQHSRSRSRSPSEETTEQNLKKKRTDTGVVIFPTEVTKEQKSPTPNNEKPDSNVEKIITNSIKEQSENGQINDLKTAISNIEEGIEVLKEQKEAENSNHELKERTSNQPNDTTIKIYNVLDERTNDCVMENGLNQDKLRDKVQDRDNDSGSEEDKEKFNETLQLSCDTDEDSAIGKEKEKLSKLVEHTPTKKIKQDTPNKKLTPKQMQKKLEVEKRNQEKQKEREELMKKKLEEKERILQEKLKRKEMKEKEIEQKRKEKEEKEEKKKKEREEKEQKRKEKEEKEELKRKEREQDKQKKLQEIEEKNKEKLKKQKEASAFVNFFVSKKSEDTQNEKKVQVSNFLEFEVKSDMKLPLPRRPMLSKEEKEKLESYIQNQNEKASYLKDLSCGKQIGKSLKTWPYEETIDDDVIAVDLGETISEDKSCLQRYRTKFLYFHENRRPAYYGTWRKKSKSVTSRKPFGEDKDLLNYEEDSDDDWEEEEQGESLNGSEDEADKENEDGKDDYEVDNEFFVPHGHLSDDEVDDEEMARLSPDSLKQKLKLLKEEFDQDMQSKTHKLKPRSIGCIWYNRDGSNVEDPVDRYLQPLAVITRHTQIIIKSRIDIPNLIKEKKNKVVKELDPELIPSFLKIVHGSSKKKSVLVEQFLNGLQKDGNTVNISKSLLIRQLKQFAVWEKYIDEETKRYKFHWFVHPDLREKYHLSQ